MAIYNDIFQWSANKAIWIKDSLRRILTQLEISDDDIVEIKQLLKKEYGFSWIKLNATPLKESDIPDDSESEEAPVILLDIKNPTNINALHSESVLEFNKEGLNIIYGDNGSGKSGYARLLKKVCWSRDKNVFLRQNVFDNQNIEQEFTIDYSKNSVDNEFKWTNTSSVPTDLNSINVFDIQCASLYINYENPTEYKPAGIDALERLIDVFNKVAAKLDEEINQINIDIPYLDDKYSETETYKWYLKPILEKTRAEIKDKIVFSEDNKNRLSALNNLLAKSNPEKENNDLLQKRKRYNSVLEKITAILFTTNLDKINFYNSILKDFKAKKEANNIASKKYKGDDPLEGIGSETWRQLWEAAKKFAISEVHPQSNTFPSDLSEKYCVFCQQALSEDAKARINRFYLFITNTTSSELNKARFKLNEIINTLSRHSIDIDDTIEEIDGEIEGYKAKFLQLKTAIEQKLKSIISNLNNEIEIQHEVISSEIVDLIKGKISEIDNTIKNNTKLITERQSLKKEQMELAAMEELFKHKSKYSTYYENSLNKHWLEKAKAQTNTRIVSQKIGEIQENKAIQEQHNEFKRYLTSLNSEIAEKVIIKKTRTSQGATYQQCKFENINIGLNEVLSEGEQKIISLSNFISECTINNSKKSIVFDDPVTSLDQNYKEKIASLITGLSTNRQVIILTHDLNFVRLLIDESNKAGNNGYKLIGLKSYNGISGITTDEIPYLAKNIQERINSIRSLTNEIKGISPTQVEKIEEKVEIASKRIRFLLEKSVEDILANKSIQRFSKNINLKAKQLSGYVVTEKSDIEFLLKLFGKYSVPEHDGGVSTEYQKPSLVDITNDLADFEKWKNDFATKQNDFIKVNGY